VRFWLTGFFPVVLVAYFLSNPLEQLIGTGNFQTAVWVPAVEELIKVLPLFLWTTVLRPKHRHGTLSDFWILGFAIGAGFSFYEDALYQRLVASGFGHGLTGTLFPIFLTGSQFVITHAGWTALAAFGVGVFSLYRTRTWGWIVGLGFVLVPILDHAAVNWRGGGADFIRTVVLHGRLASTLLVITVIGAVAHDWYVLRWASTRDKLFPSPGLRGDFKVVQAPGSIDKKVTAVVARQRYRRMRNAAFSDLYRVRSHGKSAGDRHAIVTTLVSLADTANAPTGLSVHQP
jgi:RsiW-degrading membrane proteinase PrsW (M82 family)